MTELRIGRSTVLAKDYACSEDDTYFPKEQLRLWLYVYLTDRCPAACPFCVNRAQKGSCGQSLDPERLHRVLRVIAPVVSGISMTGGEPMSDIPLLEETIAVIQETVPPEIELDMVTNGFKIERLPGLKGLERFATVHISRQEVEDDANARLMGWPEAPTRGRLKDVFSTLRDPGITVLNCVLQKNGISDIQGVRSYLEMASDICAANVSFIGMFPANDYCASQYVSPASLDFSADKRFTTWNHFHDHDYCQCSTGDYHAKAGYVRYYYRCPGRTPPLSYCRQLVYGSDNTLRQGFGNAPVLDV